MPLLTDRILPWLQSMGREGLNSNLQYNPSMTPTEYTALALRSENTRKYIIDEKGYGSIELSQIDHAAKGLVTEAAEIEDALKKSLVYGKPLDKVNLVEEAGDVLWYLALLLRTLGSSFEEAMDKNVRKLEVRYGGQFSSQKALTRDLDAERAELEK